MSWFTDREKKKLAEIEVSLKKNADFISSISSTAGVCTIGLPASSTCTVSWSGLVARPYNDYDVIKHIEEIYEFYKFSIPSERSDNKRRKYFKALSIEEIPDNRLLFAGKREVERARLEGFILCSILSDKFKWTEDLGKWFYQSKNDPDLVILRSWIENN